MTTVLEAVHLRCMERGLRRSTMLSYERLLGRVVSLDTPVDQITEEAVLTALWQIDNPNTRRSCVVAVRAVLGFQIKVPRAVPRRYNLPDEDTLRLALMTSPFEDRLLCMAYAGLRCGEACAVGPSDLHGTSTHVAKSTYLSTSGTSQVLSRFGDRLRVTRQVVEETRTGYPTVVRVAPVKTSEAEIVIPEWLAERIAGMEGTVTPSSVRESLRRAGRRVGIDLNPHQLRHWYATTMLARGVPMIVVSRQMRHSDVTTTLRTYAQANDGIEVHRAFG